MEEKTGKIIIKETKNCDSRAVKDPEDLTEDKVKQDTLYHIEAVEKCGDFFCDLIKNQFKEHDHTKLGDDLPDFIKAMKAHLDGKSFKDQPWWKTHLTERHHLNDKVPEDVNLIDVLEMICDCVSAGLARTGEIYDLTIPDKVLKDAFNNTVEMLKKKIEVEKPDEEKEEKNKAMKLFGLDSKEEKD